MNQNTINQNTNQSDNINSSKNNQNQQTKGQINCKQIVNYNVLQQKNIQFEINSIQNKINQNKKKNTLTLQRQIQSKENISNSPKTIHQKTQIISQQNVIDRQSGIDNHKTNNQYIENSKIKSLNQQICHQNSQAQFQTKKALQKNIEPKPMEKQYNKFKIQTKKQVTDQSIQTGVNNSQNISKVIDSQSQLQKLHQQIQPYGNAPIHQQHIKKQKQLPQSQDQEIQDKKAKKRAKRRKDLTANINQEEQEISQFIYQYIDLIDLTNQKFNLIVQTQQNCINQANYQDQTDYTQNEQLRTQNQSNKSTICNHSTTTNDPSSNNQPISNTSIQSQFNIDDKQSLKNLSNIQISQKINKSNQKRRKNLYKKLQQNDIIILDHQQLYSKIKLRNITEYANYEIIDVDVRVGKYEKNVKIYNSLTQSCFHSIKPYNSGSFGNIYLWSYFQQAFIVKCVSKTSENKNQYYQNSKQKHIFFKQILKQYLIAYIAGVLEIGPKVLTPFGFDLVVSKKCIQFYIQRCKLPQYYLQNIHTKFEQIKDTLYSLHLLNLVHNDIKPQNIMYNQRTNKLFFIDFGLSQYISKPLGYKKLTKFVGTFQYSSPQMQRLLFSNQYGKIDLYYNDAYSLNTTLNKLFQIQKKQQKLQDNPYSPSTCQKLIRNFLNKIFLKFFIWQDKIQSAITLANVINLKNKFDIQQQILNFIKKLKYSQNIKLLYHQCIHYSLKQMDKYKKLNQYYVKSQNIRFDLFSDLTDDKKYEDFKKFYNYLEIYEAQTKIADDQLTSYRQRLSNKQQKIILLSAQDTILSYQRYWELYINFIHFFKRNQQISIEEKNKVSLIVLKRHKIKLRFCRMCNQSNIPINFQAILECLYYLLEQCFQQSLNQFKVKIFYEVTLNCLILGWNIQIQTIKNWSYTILSFLQDPKKLLINYLEFLFLQYMPNFRHMKINNQQAIDKINIKIKENFNEFNSTQQIKYDENFQKTVVKYQNQKRQKQNNIQKQQYNTTSQRSHIQPQKQQIKLSLLLYSTLKRNKNLIYNNQIDNFYISLIQDIVDVQKIDKFDLIPREKINLIQQKIDSISQNHTQNKNQIIKLKNYLWFWIIKRLNYGRSMNRKIFQFFQKISKNTYKSSNLFQIQIHFFQQLQKSICYKGYGHIKQSLQYLDQTINCQQISQDFCMNARLIFRFIMKDSQQFIKITKKIQNLEIKSAQDVNLIRLLAFSYQNLSFLSVLSSFDQKCVCVLRFQLWEIFKRFIFQIDKRQQLKRDKYSAYYFSQTIIALLAVGYYGQKQVQSVHHDYLQSLLPPKINQQTVYLQIFQKLTTEYPSYCRKSDYINSKILYLHMMRKFKQIEQLFQNQNIIKLEIQRSMNYRNLNSIMLYLCAKLHINNWQKNFHQQKVIKLCQKMKQIYNQLFSYQQYYQMMSNRRFIQFMQIIFVLSHDYKSIVQHFMMITKYVSDNASQASVFYFQLCFLGTFNTFIPLYGEYYTIRTKFRQIYNQIKFQFRLSKIWENPYLILFIYSLAVQSQLDQKQFQKVNKYAAKTFDFLIPAGKKNILRNYYQNFLPQSKKRWEVYKSRYLLKKHYRYSGKSFIFQNLLNVRIIDNQFHENSPNKFPGYMQIRKKIYRYYDNIDAIQKVNIFNSEILDVDFLSLENSKSNNKFQQLFVNNFDFI